MTAHATLTERNHAYATEYRTGRPALVPTLRALILSCADHRADPAHVLGLGPNDAVVFRNPGGRVAPDFLRSLAVIATVATAERLPTGFELILMQHTDCGLSHLSPHAHADVLSSFFGVDRAEVAEMHIGDPHLAVLSDVERLRTNPMVPRTLVVSGLVYDVDTGLVETVVPPAPLGAMQR